MVILPMKMARASSRPLVSESNYFELMEMGANAGCNYIKLEAAQLADEIFFKVSFLMFQ